MRTLPDKQTDPAMFYAVLYGLPLTEVIRLVYVARTWDKAERLMRDASNPHYVPPPLPH